MNKVNLFLDSGAFSAWSKKEHINMDDYISFIKENNDYILVYSVLDVIGNPEATLNNQQIMEKQGLNPIPCFHYMEDIKYLKQYIDNYKYISLGGMIPIATKDLLIWLDFIFSNYICDKKTGIPKVKVHGFGMTSLVLMLRYPWYSVDSTSWVMTSRFGAVYVPRYKQGEYIYNENSWKVCVSNRSPSIKEEGQHFNTFSKMEQKIILDYFTFKGFKIGKSELRPEPKTYKLKENERWFGKEEADSQRNIHGEKARDGYATGYQDPMKDGGKTRLVETVIESGLCNDYKQRDELNIIYFLDLEKSMPKWPWPFKQRTMKGFELK
jgi:hypothetical protein